MRIRATSLTLSALAAVAMVGGALADDGTLPAVGRVGIGERGLSGKGGCTGVLVAPDIVLTATHCVMTGTTERPADPGRIGFSPAVRPGIATDVFTAASVELPSRRGPIGGDAGLDVARITLSRPVPAGVAGPLPIAAIAEGADLTLAGYPADPASDLSVLTGCPLRFVDPVVVIAGCEVVSGFSGGAMLLSTDEGPSLVAVIVARGGKREAPLAYGIVPDR